MRLSVYTVEEITRQVTKVASGTRSISEYRRSMGTIKKKQPKQDRLEKSATNHNVQLILNTAAGTINEFAATASWLQQQLQEQQ